MGEYQDSACEWGVGACACMPALRRLRQTRCSESEVSLRYRVRP